MRRNLCVFVALALALAASACSGSPAAPTVVPPPGTPKSGTITATWVRPAGKTCLSAGSEWDRCSDPPRVGWRVGGPPSVSIPMNGPVTGSGTFTASGVAEAGWNRIAVSDPWDCPPTNGCDVDFIGNGIAVNGVRLNNGGTESAFEFIPPDTIIPK